MSTNNETILGNHFATTYNGSGSGISHTTLTNIGSNTHAQIDTHIAATSGVHGATGSIVGTTDTQTLTNKTISAPLIDLVTLNNSITDILGLNGTTLNYKNNVVDTTTAQTLTNKTLTAPIFSSIINVGTLLLPNISTTIVGRSTTDTLTNKTIDSSTNTITITSTPLSGTNINTVINQSVTTSAVPSFAGGLWLVGANVVVRRVPFRAVIPNGAPTPVYTFSLTAGQSAFVNLQFNSNCLTGADQGFANYLYDFVFINNAGVISNTTGINQSTAGSNISGAFLGTLIRSFTISAPNVTINLASSLINSHNVGGFIEICYSP